MSLHNACNLRTGNITHLDINLSTEISKDFVKNLFKHNNGNKKIKNLIIRYKNKIITNQKFS